ncbi:molybdenum cofactor biosynthesis protein C, partial [Blyttiomyces helicus]
LTHTTPSGSAHMVDVTTKPSTNRTATAQGRVLLSSPHAFSLLKEDRIKKGNVLTVAQIAGTNAAKQTGLLIPLCHPLMLSHIDVKLTLCEDDLAVDIEASVRCLGPTGVEMEALMAVSIAACTVFDMCKAVDRGMRIMDVRVTEKKGGRSGDWVAE